MKIDTSSHCCFCLSKTAHRYLVVYMYIYPVTAVLSTILCPNLYCLFLKCKQILYWLSNQERCIVSLIHDFARNYSSCLINVLYNLTSVQIYSRTAFYINIFFAFHAIGQTSSTKKK